MKHITSIQWVLPCLLLLLASCGKEETVSEDFNMLYEEASITQSPSQSVQREAQVDKLLTEGKSLYENFGDGLAMGNSFFEFAPDSTIGSVIFLDESMSLYDNTNYGRAVFQWGDGSEGKFLTLLYDWDSFELLGYLSEETTVLPW